MALKFICGQGNLTQSSSAHWSFLRLQEWQEIHIYEFYHFGVSQTFIIFTISEQFRLSKLPSSIEIGIFLYVFYLLMHNSFYFTFGITKTICSVCLSKLRWRQLLVTSIIHLLPVSTPSSHGSRFKDTTIFQQRDKHFLAPYVFFS